MKGMQKPMKTILSIAIVSLMGTGAAQAAGFSLYTEGSAAAEGNYAAGIAAEAADASTGWYNPAGLVLLHKQEVVFGGAGIFPDVTLTGSSTFNTSGASPFVQNFDRIHADKNAFVPSLHYALPLGENAAFGLSFIAPFGLATDWGQSSPVRYSATYTNLVATDISPELGVRLTDNLALGAGIDFQYVLVKFNSIVGSPQSSLLFGQSPAFLDSLSNNRGHSIGVGFHAGAMAMSTDNHTRIGVNYQSRVDHKFEGRSRFTGRLAAAGFANPNALFQTDDLFSNTIQFPDVLTLSGYRDLNDKIALLGSVVYTHWNLFKTIELDNVAGTTGTAPNRLNSTNTEFYKDAWRFALGANVHLNERWMLRVGGGYDQTPTTDANRDIRIPDSSRWALAVGAHYDWRPNLGVDVGYTHLWTDATPINKTIATGSTSNFNINAEGNSSVDLVGAQLTWIMDKPAIPDAGK